MQTDVTAIYEVIRALPHNRNTGKVELESISLDVSNCFGIYIYSIATVTIE